MSWSRSDWKNVLEELDDAYCQFLKHRNSGDVTGIEEISEEISRISEKIEIEIRELIENIFPGIRVLAYDSLVHDIRNDSIGRILSYGVRSKARTYEVEKEFRIETGIKIAVERIEDLPDGEREETEKLFAIGQVD